MTRAERRARMERAKQRVKRLSICWDGTNPRVVGRLAQTRRPCSCEWCHGHMRAVYGPTMQERRLTPPRPVGGEG